ncbi:hypothetical protein [Nitrococcus mobilis]|uniref:hypothetical protein n=1 Tax=Nitrococcus mobilis TaxID=35797 RepID=UPI0012EA91BE|nr:hypothetical protein [Nitrococcus mobilis]
MTALRNLAASNEQIGTLWIDKYTHISASVELENIELKQTLGIFLDPVQKEEHITDKNGRLVIQGFEGAIIGAGVSALLMGFKSTAQSIGNPALVAFGCIAIGAIAWPRVTKFSIMGNLASFEK